MFGASQLLVRYTGAAHLDAGSVVMDFDARTIWAACVFIASKLFLCKYERPLGADMAKNYGVSAKDMVDAERHVLNTIKHNIGDLISGDSAHNGS